MIGTAARLKWIVESKFRAIAFCQSVNRLIFERCGGRAPRIAEQDIEAAKFLRDAVDQRGGLLRIRHIGGERGILASVDRDLRPFCLQDVRDGAAEAASAATDQRDPALQAEVHARSSRTAQTFSSAIFA